MPDMPKSGSQSSMDDRRGRMKKIRDRMQERSAKLQARSLSREAKMKAAEDARTQRQARVSAKPPVSATPPAVKPDLAANRARMDAARAAGMARMDAAKTRMDAIRAKKPAMPTTGIRNTGPTNVGSPATATPPVGKPMSDARAAALATKTANVNKMLAASEAAAAARMAERAKSASAPTSKKSIMGRFRAPVKAPTTGIQNTGPENVGARPVPSARPQMSGYKKGGTVRCKTY